MKLDGGEKFEKTKRKLEQNFAKWGLAKGLVEEQQADHDQGEQPQVIKKLNPTEQLKQQLRVKTGGGSSRSTVFEEPITAFEKEMAKYEANDQDAPENTDMLQWWKHHAQEYPRFKHDHLKSDFHIYFLFVSKLPTSSIALVLVFSNTVPRLALLVRVVFPIPAASSKSERVFSVAGRIVTPDRNRLAPEMVEDLVTMKCNLRLLKNLPPV